MVVGFIPSHNMPLSSSSTFFFFLVFFSRIVDGNQSWCLQHHWCLLVHFMPQIQFTSELSVTLQNVPIPHRVAYQRRQS